MNTMLTCLGIHPSEVARLQRWRTVGEGPQYLKIVGKVLYRLKDIEAYEEACLIRKVL